MRLPRVGVWYDHGSASPTEIVRAADGWCAVTFLVEAGRASPTLVRLLERLGAVTGVTSALGFTSGDHAFDAVTTFSETRLADTAQLAHVHHWRHHTVDTARRLTDKLAQRQALSAAGVDATKTRAVPRIHDLPGVVRDFGQFPLMLKPTQGSASEGVRKISEPATAHQLSQHPPLRGREFLVEEFLHGDQAAAGEGVGDYVSVETCSADGQHVPMCVLGKPALTEDFRERGHLYPSTLSKAHEREVAALAGAALTALGVRDGMTHTEIKLTKDGPRVLEVNGRLGGGVAALIRHATGQDPVAWALHAALGRPLDPLDRAAATRVGYEYLVRLPDQAPPPSGYGLTLKSAIEALDGVNSVRMVNPSVAAAAQDRITHIAEVFGDTGDHSEALALFHRIDATAHTLHRQRG